MCDLQSLMTFSEWAVTVTGAGIPGYMLRCTHATVPGDARDPSCGSPGARERPAPLASFGWRLARSSLDGRCIIFPAFLPFITKRRICLLEALSFRVPSTKWKLFSIVANMCVWKRGTDERFFAGPY